MDHNLHHKISTYHQNSNIRCTIEGNTIVDHSDAINSSSLSVICAQEPSTLLICVSFAHILCTNGNHDFVSLHIPTSLKLKGPRYQSLWVLHGAHLGLLAPDGPHVGPMNLAIRGVPGFNLSICPSLHMGVELFPLCFFHNTSQISFVFTHLMNQLQKVICKKFHNLNFWQIYWIFLILTLSCVVHVMWMLNFFHDQKFYCSHCEFSMMIPLDRSLWHKSWVWPNLSIYGIFFHLCLFT